MIIISVTNVDNNIAQYFLSFDEIESHFDYHDATKHRSTMLQAFDYHNR